MSYTKEWVKQYNKTWYYKLGSRWSSSPPHWISGKPIRVFGIFVGVLWKVAKPEYRWAVTTNEELNNRPSQVR